MQTMPTFVYLIPVLILFGLGAAPGLIVTVIFAAPAPIRLTHLGITSVPKALLEAGEAFGATKSQLLWKVELPSALPTIMAGLTQCIMLSLSMVVIAALNLILDFDFIEQGALRGAPKYMEWFAAFGLMVTLIWLYLEMLRLLSKLRSRR